MATITYESPNASTSFGTSHIITLPAMAAGEVAIIVFEDGGSATITDPLLGAIPLVQRHLQAFPDFSVNFRWFSAASPTGGETTITFTTSASVAAWYRVYKATGLSGEIGIVASNYQTFTVAPTSGSFTPDAGSLVSGIFINSSGRVLSGVTAGYTVLPATGSDFYFSAVDESIGAGAQSLDGTWATGVNSMVTLVEFVASGSGPQLEAPDADITDGAWVPSTGTDLYAVIDEASASDTDYASTAVVSMMEVGLSNADDPLSSTGHIVRYRISAQNSQGMTVRLMQGSTTIATWTHPALAATLTTYVQTLTGPQADSITDYTNLRLQFEATP
jgi:hypothetical protein